MTRAALVLAIVVVAAAGACDDADRPPPPPTVPETIPAPEEVETCADLVDAALGILQGQLDALAGGGGEALIDPAAPPPAALADLEPASAELAQRAAERCAPGELARLLEPRAAELRAVGPVASRYRDLLLERIGG